MKTLIIDNASMVCDPLVGEFSTGKSAAIAGSEIAELGAPSTLREKYPDADHLDAAGCLLLPGLVDAHTHLYGALIQAMPPCKAPLNQFSDVLEHVWWVWDRALTAEDNAISAQLGCAASLRSGITTIFDHHASPNAIDGSLSLLAKEIERCGLRACLAYEVSDRNGSANCDAGIAENRRFIMETQKNNNPLLKALFGLHAVFSLSDESLNRCGRAAAELGTGCHLHVAEHRAEVNRFANQHQQTILQFLAEAGILGPQSILAHTVHVSSEDIDVMKAHHVFNAHNPQSNMGNGVGVSPVPTMLAVGQTVCLGSDGFFNLPQQITYAQLLQSVASGKPGVLSDEQMVKVLYGHNMMLAESVFGCRLGKIAPGYTADLILIGYDPAAPVEAQNQYSHIVSALMVGQVKTALVGGRVVMKDGHILGIDEPRTRAEAKRASAALWKRF